MIRVSMARKRNTIGCLFYVALVLLALVIFLFNRGRVQEVIEKTGFTRLFEKKKGAPVEVVVAPPEQPGPGAQSQPGQTPAQQPGAAPQGEASRRCGRRAGEARCLAAEARAGQGAGVPPVAHPPGAPVLHRRET